ncbi:MAG: hypothetical protein WDN09_01440 [bacterium]
MKISYNWLKWYIPDVLTPEKLADVFTYHLAEVEDVEKKGDDHIFDINILPNRAHDLLSHQGIAREVASQLGIDYVDPTPKYKVPESRPTALEIKVESDKCRRYMGRIVRNVKVGPSPDWVKETFGINRTEKHQQCRRRRKHHYVRLRPAYSCFRSRQGQRRARHTHGPRRRRDYHA